MPSSDVAVGGQRPIVDRYQRRRRLDHDYTSRGRKHYQTRHTPCSYWLVNTVNLYKYYTIRIKILFLSVPILLVIPRFMYKTLLNMYQSYLRGYMYLWGEGNGVEKI